MASFIRANKRPGAQPETVNGYAVGVWHEFSGGHRPIDGDVTVCVRIGDGDVVLNKAGLFVWKWSTLRPENNIIAFYIVPTPQLAEEAKP